MPSRSGPVHVAINKRHYKGKTYTSYLLRRSRRVGKQVKHETLGNLSHLPAPVKGGVNLDHFGGAKVDQLVKG